MLGSSNSSFIPKQGTHRPEQRSASRQVFVGTIVARVILLATLLAAAGTFVYERQVKLQLQEEIGRFKAEATIFESDSDKFAEILEFDDRLSQAAALRAQSISTQALFAAIERATVRTVQFTNFELTRETPEELLVTAEVRTDTFDSTLFQRSIFTESEVLQAAEIEEVIVGLEGSVAARERDARSVTADTEGVEDEEGITFTASILINPATIPALAEGVSGIVPMSGTVIPGAAGESTIVPAPAPESAVPGTVDGSLDGQ